MDMNATILGQFIALLAIAMAIVGCYLGKRKTQTPILTSVTAFFSALIPPVALIFLIILVIKNDVNTLQKKGS